MRQFARATVLAATAAFSLTACGQGGSAKAAAPSTVAQQSSTTSTRSTTTAAIPAAPAAPAAPVTVTQTAVVPATPTSTVTQTATAAAPDVDNGSNCYYNGQPVALYSHLSCGFAQNVIAAYEGGNSSAYSPATGGWYTFACTTNDSVLDCGSDGTSGSIQHGGSLEYAL